MAKIRQFRVMKQFWTVRNGQHSMREKVLGVFSEGEARKLLLSGPCSQDPIEGRWAWTYAALDTTGFVHLHHWRPGEISETDVRTDPALQECAIEETHCRRTQRV